MQSNPIPQLAIQAIIGLGNPGPMYLKTRHNIGFLVVDALADQFNASWSTEKNMLIAHIIINDHKILLIKPQTYMNDSGQVCAALKKKGIEQDNILVVHDELELPFGALKFKFDGSAKGHNGLKSIIAHGGSNFLRLRFGIDRPELQAHVPDYVLAKFTQSQTILDEKISAACDMIIKYLTA